MPKKGIKSTAGQGELWDEPKSETISLRLTPTAKELMDAECQRLGISRGELVERVVRVSGNLPTDPVTQDKLKIILASLHELSRSELAKVLISLGRVLYSKTESHNTFESIAELVTQNWSVLELEGMTQKNLTAIAAGELPTRADLIRIATILNMDCNQLSELANKSVQQKQVENGFTEVTQ